MKNIVSFFKRLVGEKVTDEESRVRNIARFLQPFIENKVISKIEKYTVGPVTSENIDNVNHIAKVFGKQRLSSGHQFDVIIGDFVIFYLVTAEEQKFFFLDAITPIYDRKRGFLKVFDDGFASLNGDSKLRKFVAYENGFIFFASNELSDSEYPAKGKKYIGFL